MGSKYLGDWMMPFGRQTPFSNGNPLLSDSVKAELNAETNAIFRSCAEEVEKMLTKERVILDRFAGELLKREELEYDEIEAIFAEYGKSRAQAAASTPSDPPKNGLA